jgi:hypothetical protein
VIAEPFGFTLGETIAASTMNDANRMKEVAKYLFFNAMSYYTGRYTYRIELHDYKNIIKNCYWYYNIHHHHYPKETCAI